MTYGYLAELTMDRPYGDAAPAIWIPNVGWICPRTERKLNYRNMGAETIMQRWARLQPDTKYVPGETRAAAEWYDYG
jgi:hypothetical protein